MRRKFAALALVAALCTIGFTACDFDFWGGNDDAGKNQDEWGSVYTVEAAYKVATDLGFTGTLDEFIATISGKDGVGIQSASVNADGDLIIVLTNGNEINCGNVKEPEPDGTEGLYYISVKEDGQTVGYGVRGIGAATEKEIVIPSTYKGKPVVSIAANAFYESDGANNLGSLYSIVIPDTVTTIEEGAFEGCSDLEYVVIPSSVTSIHLSAFRNGNAQKKLFFCGTAEEWGNSATQFPEMQSYIITVKTSRRQGEISGITVLTEKLPLIGNNLATIIASE